MPTEAVSSRATACWCERCTAGRSLPAASLGPERSDGVGLPLHGAVTERQRLRRGGGQEAPKRRRSIRQSAGDCDLSPCDVLHDGQVGAVGVFDNSSRGPQGQAQVGSEMARSFLPQ